MQSQEAQSTTISQPFDYFLVLDFEASCDDKTKVKGFKNEVIEFPTVAINAKTMKIDHTFHYYVKPKMNPILTDFCKDLTGIQQDWVDNGLDFKECMKLHNQWMMEHFIEKNLKFAFVVCGDWDLKIMIINQCKMDKLSVPSYFSEWINIKKMYAQIYNKPVRGMTSMLRDMNLQLEGRHHSGIDDCKNIGRVLVEMLKQGKLMQITTKMSVGDQSEKKNSKQKRNK